MTSERRLSRENVRSGIVPGTADTCWLQPSAEAANVALSMSSALRVHFAFVRAQRLRRVLVHVLAGVSVAVWASLVLSTRLPAEFAELAIVAWAACFASVAVIGVFEWRLRERWRQSVAMPSMTSREG